ncbi:MAG TPA: hypothetical protein PK771_08585 [Spirochaetota bacterium]|nr:hypothetical protein [Spirochaetota bacterium]
MIVGCSNDTKNSLSGNEKSRVSGNQSILENIQPKYNVIYEKPHYNEEKAIKKEYNPTVNNFINNYYESDDYKSKKEKYLKIKNNFKKSISKKDELDKKLAEEKAKIFDEMGVRK